MIFEINLQKSIDLQNPKQLFSLASRFIRVELWEETSGGGNPYETPLIPYKIFGVMRYRINKQIARIVTILWSLFQNRNIYMFAIDLCRLL